MVARNGFQTSTTGQWPRNYIIRISLNHHHKPHYVNNAKLARCRSSAIFCSADFTLNASAEFQCSVPGLNICAQSQVSVSVLSLRSQYLCSVPGLNICAQSQVSISVLRPRSQYQCSVPGLNIWAQSHFSISVLSLSRRVSCSCGAMIDVD